ncbi:MAG: biotin synthase BioB [bacterium]|nr:biotin synthase BioB [bacterium]
MNYTDLAKKSLETGTIENEDIRQILRAPDVELLPLLESVYRVRYKYYQNNVKIHILHNVRSGNCTEDCRYCAQSKESHGAIESYPVKSDDEILEAAALAHKAGAYRHCMVFSGRDLAGDRIETICRVVKQIKERYPMEICVSAGFLTAEDAERLRGAGVNRYNHNLNTSSGYYEEICTTHDYSKRVETIQTAKSKGLDICSGVIIGMGESDDDIISMIAELKQVEAKSIPINFFIPTEGHRIPEFPELTPNYCLRLLAAFRFAIPEAEIRAAAGREHHLRSQQALCLYAVNSIFARGYLTTGGDDIETTKRMIEDSGFVVEEIEE